MAPLGPFRQIVAYEDDIVLAPADLGEHGLEGTLADITFAHFEKCGLIVF